MPCFTSVHFRHFLCLITFQCESQIICDLGLSLSVPPTYRTGSRIDTLPPMYFTPWFWTKNSSMTRKFIQSKEIWRKSFVAQLKYKILNWYILWIEDLKCIGIYLRGIRHMFYDNSQRFLKTSKPHVLWPVRKIDPWRCFGILEEWNM